jgi:hypothetical protein
MWKRRKGNATLNAAAERIGRTLGSVAGRIEHWQKERGRLAAELDRLMRVASGLRADLAPVRRPARRIGRITRRAIKRARRRL